jgi:threonine dehydratase
MNLKTMAHRAASRIGPFIRTTPLEHSPPFSKETGVEVWLKLECLQYTRSFKVRGALNRLQTLTVQERGRGVVTASTGNHGLATAYGLGRLGLTGTIYLPETASPRKIELLRAAGADLVFHGADSAETEAFARQQAGIQEKVYISPYNDPEVVAGQGTLGIELLDQLPELASVFVPVGGGGLIGGIAGYLKTVRPSVRVIGCLPRMDLVARPNDLVGRAFVEPQSVLLLRVGSRV